MAKQEAEAEPKKAPAKKAKHGGASAADSGPAGGAWVKDEESLGNGVGIYHDPLTNQTCICMNARRQDAIGGSELAVGISGGDGGPIRLQYFCGTTNKIKTADLDHGTVYEALVTMMEGLIPNRPKPQRVETASL